MSTSVTKTAAPATGRKPAPKSPAKAAPKTSPKSAAKPTAKPAAVPAKKAQAKAPAPKTPAKAPALRKNGREATLARVEAVRLQQRNEGNFDCFGRAGEGYCDQGGCLYHAECLSVSRMLHSM
jgi:hypothetical protein